MFLGQKKNIKLPKCDILSVAKHGLLRQDFNDGSVRFFTLFFIIFNRPVHNALLAWLCMQQNISRGTTDPDY